MPPSPNIPYTQIHFPRNPESIVRVSVCLFLQASATTATSSQTYRYATHSSMEPTTAYCSFVGDTLTRDSVPDSGNHDYENANVNSRASGVYENVVTDLHHDKRPTVVVGLNSGSNDEKADYAELEKPNAVAQLELSDLEPEESNVGTHVVYFEKDANSYTSEYDAVPTREEIFGTNSDQEEEATRRMSRGSCSSWEAALKSALALAEEKENGLPGMTVPQHSEV